MTSQVMEWEPAEWKFDDEGNAVFIDQEPEEGVEYVKNELMGEWDQLPDLIIERIFSYLSFSERFHCSLVCKSWYEAFHSPTVWHTFVLEDKILVRRKFNLCYGWQDYLDKLRSHFFLQKMGKHMRYLIFSPMSNMNGANMQFQFIHILTTYAIRNPLDHIQHLKFTFSCPVLATSQISDGAVQAHPGLGTSSSVYGTGGDMMTCLKSLMAILPGLTRLELINLMLDSSEALKLLDQVCWTCCGTMHTLNLVNFTKLPCAILHPGVFIKLRSLTISPQNLSADLVWLLGNLSKLRNLYIVHQPVQKNDATAAIGSVDAAVWVQLNRNNPRLRVHLKCSGRFTNLTLVWQNKAPVTTIVYESPYTRVATADILTVVDNYQSSLRVYGHLGLPRFHTSRSFQERIDSSMVLLVRRCQHLHTLVIRERISTMTLLLIAHWGRSLRRLYVRRNCLILKSDWPRNLDWSDEFHQWLCHTARSYQSTEEQVGILLGCPSWQLLSDRKFKSLVLNVQVDSDQ